MKVATFNINGIKARLPRLVEWLEKTQPDVACLQELKSSDETMPTKEIEAAGYGFLYHGQKGFNGVAILARDEQPVEIQRGLEGEAEDEQSRYLEADVRGVRVGCIYLPNGNPQPGPKFDYKQAWFERLIRHARGLIKTGAPVALVGDFNVVPADFDIYPTKSWDNDALVHPESRAAFERLLKQGWTDAIRMMHPEDPMYTFWDYKRRRWDRDAGLRIDHFILSPQLLRRLKKSGVDRSVRGEDGASDHAPAWIELK
jgi:exodeoxyribonuclease III